MTQHNDFPQQNVVSGLSDVQKQLVSPLTLKSADVTDATSDLLTPLDPPRRVLLLQQSGVVHVLL